MQMRKNTSTTWWRSLSILRTTGSVSAATRRRREEEARRLAAAGVGDPKGILGTRESGSGIVETIGMRQRERKPQ